MRKINLRKLEMEISKTGFPLELRCALKLQRREWDVMNNFIFEDPEEQKHRELDILACDAPPIFNNQRCLTIYALIECKKSEYPWVFFPSRNKTDRVILGLHDMVFRDGEKKRADDETGTLISDLRWNSRFNDSKIFSWFFETESKKHEMYDAISKLAKSTYYVTVGQREDLEPMHPPLLYIVYQAIVLDGLLCSASVQGKRFHISPIKHAILGMNYVSPAFRTHMLIDVIQAGYFPKYIRTLEEERDKFVKIANDFHATMPALEP